MTASELAGWMEYFSIYPFKMVREYEQAAMIAQMVVNSSMRVKKPVKIEKFLPSFLLEKPHKKASVQQQRAEWSAFVAEAKSKGIA